MLQLENVTRIWPGNPAPVHAVSDLSLQLSSGEFVAVQGPSGCGKSTLLLMAGGLLQPTTGDVRINGANPYTLSADERATFRARTVGFVFQQFHLVPYLDVLDNVLAPSIAVPNTSSNVRQRAEELVEHLGLGHRKRHVPGQLSSGERQRTALARALLNQPQVLLADEPTGNLDPDSAHAVLGYLKEFAESGGAVLLVTHDDRALPFAQHVIHMHEGQVTPA